MAAAMKKGTRLLCPVEECDHEEPLDAPTPLPEGEEATEPAAQA